jgi:hypothetical protein
MKKIFMAILIVGIMISPVFAGDGKELTGTVSSIDPIDPARGDLDGGIILRDDAGKETSFDLTTSTVISDKTTGKIDSGDIQDGNKVSVTYTESGEGLSADTITRL